MKILMTGGAGHITLVGESMAQPFLYLGENVTNGLKKLTIISHVNRFK